MILMKLFLVFFRIGLFAVGGAYSFLPLLEKELVESYKWLSKPEFLDILGMIKIFPGAISIKFATYTGYKIAGLPGAVLANLGNILAPVLLISFGAGLYMKYKDLPRVKGAFSMIQLAVFAMVIAVAFKLIKIEQLVQLKSLLVIVICFAALIYTRVHPAFVIVGAGIVGALIK